jgi:hypothetical protein
MAKDSFDWPDFLNLAVELSSRPEESCLRTAIGRAYYYTYHLARQRVLDNGFSILPGGDSHKQVWEKFGNSPKPGCKKLYGLGTRLKDKRQRADYDRHYARIQDEFPAVLDLAHRFATELSALPARHPLNTGVRN